MRISNFVCLGGLRGKRKRLIHEEHEGARRKASRILNFVDMESISSSMMEKGVPMTLRPVDEGNVNTQTEIFMKDEVYQVIGAAIEVHKVLGNGFLEPVYQEAFEIELGSQSMPYESQAPLKITYKGKQLRKEYVADLICFGGIIVELKALNKLSGVERSQIINYLKATELKVGLLINFGSTGKLEWEKFVF